MQDTEIPENDSFFLDSSLMKARLDAHLDIENLEEISIPSNFTITHPNMEKENYSAKIREFIEPIAQKSEELGFGHNIFSAIYEGTLNAFQHGNKSDESRKIIFAHNLCEKKIEFLICDEGKKLHPKFLRFIRKFRSRDNQTSSFINWYKHAEEDKTDIPNQGYGTSYMHAYMSSVRYFRSKETKGLALYLAKYSSQ